MAELFFKKEVQKLYLDEGPEFCSEGILTVIKARIAEMNLPTGGIP
jgi:hypothetical protein